MKSLDILREAELIPLSVLGQGRIANKKLLLSKLTRHRRMLTVMYGVLFAVAVAVAVATAVFGMRSASPAQQSATPFLCGAAFLALLAYARHLTKELMLCSLPLMVAQHASDDQLADFITNLLGGFGKSADKSATPHEQESAAPPAAAASDAPTPDQTARSKVVIISSQQDRPFLDELRRHLVPIERNGLIDLWDETKIEVGSRWREEISAAIAAANLAILLVSVDLLGSELANSLQLPPLLNAAKSSGATIIPIIAGNCLYDKSPLAEFQPANSPLRPLAGMKKSDRDELLSKVAKHVLQMSTSL